MWWFYFILTLWIGWVLALCRHKIERDSFTFDWVDVIILSTLGAMIAFLMIVVGIA